MKSQHRRLLIGGVVCLLALTAHPGMAQSDVDNAPIEVNRSVPDVVAAFDALAHHGEWLGFRRNWQTPVTVGPTAGTNSDQHFQGFARSPRFGRSPVLYLTHSGNPDATLSYHRTEGRLLVVRMGSRNDLGERLRSNRLLRGEETQHTKPPLADRVVDVVNYDRGESDYKHPGGIQMVGDILAVPLEGANRGGLPEGKVVFYDCSDPESPRKMPYEFTRPHKIGVIGITRLPLPSGKFLLVLGWGDGDALDFYLSNETSFFDAEGNDSATFTFGNVPHTRVDRIRLAELEAGDFWRFGKTTPQTLNFVNQDDGQLYLIGSSNSASAAPFFNGDDHMFLWKVTGFGVEETIQLHGLRGKVHKWLSSEGDRIGNLTFDRQEANFNAAGGVYVSPTGELLYYGAAYYFYPHSTSSPPEENVERFAELRHVDVSREGRCGPHFRPNHLGGPYLVAEGSSLVVDGTVHVVDPWVHMFSKRYFLNSGVMIDWADQSLDDYDDFPKLDGAITGVVDDCRTKDGFNDCMESFRWCGPIGSALQLYDDDHFRIGNTSYPELAGTGQVFFDDDLRPEDFDSEATSARILWTPPTETYSWTLEGTGGELTPSPDGKEVNFEAGAGSSTNELHLTVWGETSSTTIEVYNVPPLIESIQFSNLSPDEGEPVTLSGWWIDPGAAEAAVSVDWGDGTPTERDPDNGGQFTFGHAYGDNGGYVVTICVDDGEDESCQTRMIDVLNVAPQVAIDAIRDEIGAEIGRDVRGVLVRLRVDVYAHFTDPGVLDTHIAHVDWGDGTVPEDLGMVVATAHAWHAYETSGEFTVTLTVIDDDQGVGVSGARIEVLDATDAIVEWVERIRQMLADPTLSPDAALALDRCIADLVGNQRGRAAGGAQDKLLRCNLNAGMIKLRMAVLELSQAEAAQEGLDLTLIKSQIALVAKSVTLDAIARAESAVENSGQLQHVRRALRRVVEGDEELGEGDFVDALEIYRRAVRDVQSLACTAAAQSNASDSSRRFKANRPRSETGGSRRR